MAYAKSVEDFFDRDSPWKNELQQMRRILLSTGLTEALKWGMPHYHLGAKNLLGLCGYKAYFGIWFHTGAELPDPAGKLSNAQPGKTKMMRQWRMTSAADIDEALILDYVQDAIQQATPS